ncbi:hypothetical protein ACFQU3_19940 [Terrabacter sp. GCM10028922]
MTAEASPLRACRLRKGWSQAAAMRRFQAEVVRNGGVAPEGASLKRMFAYWESGARAVTVPAYQQAFVNLYAAPPEALGFVPADESGRIADLRERPLEIVAVDQGLVDIFEAQTQSLRLLDRRLGSAVQAAQVEAHVRQIEAVLRRSVGNKRPALARAFAEAAALAGWQALDRADVTSAWELHESAKSAALEGGDESIAAHVFAQQGLVLLDAEQPALAMDSVAEAAQRGAATPPVMRAWLAAALAECHAALGDGDDARRRLDEADGHLAAAVADGAELPYLMLSEEHLHRWRAHCMAELGDIEAVDAATAASPAEGDSVRAATSLHTDLASAYLNAGDLGAAAAEAELALRMAERYGSARQRKRSVAILARCQREVVQQPDQRA